MQRKLNILTVELPSFKVKKKKKKTKKYSFQRVSVPNINL